MGAATKRAAKLSSLEESFKKEVEVADWSMLKSHFERGVLVSVSQTLDLIEVAVAVAEDSVEVVKEWMRKGDLKNTTVEEAEVWAAKPHEKMAEFLIVQPYVLIQPI